MVSGYLLVGAWLSVASPVTAAIPEITQPVTDLADVLDPAAEDAIARELVEHRAATGVQLAVLVLDSTQPDDIADFSQRVFTAWGGGSAERDDGALFVLAIGDRRSRLHLGYGLEPVVPDSAAQLMLDELRPALQEGRYADATLDLVRDFRDRTAHVDPGAPIGVPFGGVAWLWLPIMMLGLAAGIAWGLAFRGGLRAYAKEGKVTSKTHRKKPWTERAKLAIVALSRRPAMRKVAGSIAALQLAVVVLFASGSGYGAAYTLVLWIFLLTGWALVPAPRPIRITIGLALSFGLVVGILTLDPATPHADGAAVLGGAAPGLLTFVIFGAMSSWFVANVVYGSGGSGSGSSSYSSSGYSSSSSYSSSPSSSSSSSYSGGGGSSGGGGASSSW